jgi:hypothetical protein
MEFIRDFFKVINAKDVDADYDDKSKRLTFTFRCQGDIMLNVTKIVNEMDDNNVFIQIRVDGRTLFYCYKDINKILEEIAEDV